MTTREVSPVGETISELGIIGEELNGSGTVTGVDVELEVTNGHRYFANILTKNQYTVETTEQALDSLRELETADVAKLVADTAEVKPPFIFNDTEITPELLRRKLIGRVVLEDLAASMFQIDIVEE